MILVGQRVELTTQRTASSRGVVGKKPIHLLKDDERKRAAEMKDLHIDIGAKDGDEAKALVRIGDVAVIDAEPVELPNDRFVARAMDNRLGCFVAYEAARLVAEAGGAPGDVVAVAAVQEEITFAGARTFAHVAAAGRRDRRRRHARDRRAGHRREGERLAPVRLGPGDRARLDDAPARLRRAGRGRRGRGDRPHAERLGARFTGTDADAIHVSRQGIPTGLISLPLRYMHSPVELVQLDDVLSGREADRGVRAAADGRHVASRASARGAAHAAAASRSVAASARRPRETRARTTSWETPSSAARSS